VSAQGTDFWIRKLGLNKEAERTVEQQTKADANAENKKWNTQQMLASVMPSNSGRVIDWRKM
jgi:hypothetical protein